MNFTGREDTQNMAEGRAENKKGPAPGGTGPLKSISLPESVTVQVKLQMVLGSSAELTV
jgi:hypothetical protein